MADSRRHKTPSVDALVAHVEEAEKLIDLINQDLHRLDVPQWRRVAEAIKYNQDARELHLADNLLFAVSDEAWQLLAGAVLANESISALTLDNTGLHRMSETAWGCLARVVGHGADVRDSIRDWAPLSAIATPVHAPWHAQAP